MKGFKSFGHRGAIKCTGAQFERRKAWATKSAAERLAEAEWNGVERRVRQHEYRPAERQADHATRKIHFEGLATYAVIVACLGFAFWQIAGMGVDGLHYVVGNITVALGN